uniref:peptidylprolyl isomerase n=1 Tax=Quercus lobata TaxID=97700 RepID=A0A7N2L985_QUELO
MAWISGVVSLPFSSNIGCSRVSITPQSLHQPHSFSVPTSCGDPDPTAYGKVVERRKVLISSVGMLAAGFWWNASMDGVSVAAEYADMPALRGKDYGKTKMRYPDYTETESGLQYKDLRVGNGPIPKMGETVVVDWDGYTIGYYGRIFEARNKTKGGSFVGDDKDFFKFRIGSQEVIPAFEEAVSGMAPGGIRSCIKSSAPAM